MIIRLWLISGTLLVGVAWYLMVPLSPAPVQVSATPTTDEYRQAGLLPQPGEMTFSSKIGHDVFEIPETDAIHAAEEAAKSGDAMPGMDMKGMDMGGPATGKDAEAPMQPMAMGEAQPGPAEAPMQPMAMGEAKDAPAEVPMQPMAMGEAKDAPAEAPMQPMAMGEARDAPAEAPMQPMAMGEAKDAPAEAPDMAMEEGEHAGGRGLRVLSPQQAKGRVDREITIAMKEWGFESGNLTVKAGETIRFIVRNTGNIPHEFMFMPAEGMQAVNYRLERADWNLTEHEALFERAIVLPGDGFEVVVKVEQPGMWMYMCMFPYHMQFGMMGMMMTEGMSMDGGSAMGGMKM